jgi:hypothetical protein
MAQFDSLIETFEQKSLISSIKLLLGEAHYKESKLIDMGPTDVMTPGYTINAKVGQYYPQALALGYTIGYGTPADKYNDNEKYQIRVNALNHMKEALEAHYNVEFVDKNSTNFKSIVNFPAPYLVVKIK